MDRADQVVLVIDPKRVDKARYRGEAAAEVAAARARDPDNVAPLDVTVQEGCFSADELLEALQVLLARDWHPRADEVPLMHFLDPHDSTFHVFLPKEEDEVAQALKKQLGDRVTLQEGGPEATSGTSPNRLNDASPHWGGSTIGAGGVIGSTSQPAPGHCTAGFAVTIGQNFPVVSARGQRGMITAGHCYDDAGEDGGAVYSGTRAFGVPMGEDGSLTPLNNDGTTLANLTGTIINQNYTNRIYTNARQNLAEDPTIDDPSDMDPFRMQNVTYTLAVPTLTTPNVCYSGRISGNTCKAVVDPIPIVFCPVDPLDIDPLEGCVIGARLTRQASYQTNTKGDSGGPVYICNNFFNEQTDKGCVPTTDTVSAVGIITGRPNSILFPNTGVFSPVSDLAPALGVQILTSP